MRRVLAVALATLLSLSVLGCTPSAGGSEAPPPQSQPPVASEQAQVTALVEQFGQKLQAVSLQAPASLVTKSMQEQYGGLVAPELLAQWQSNPQTAPGRVTSSPWPDRIEVRSVANVAPGDYRVTGEVIEVTSVEKVQGGAAAKRPITLDVKKVNGRWLITAVTLESYASAESVLYRNPEFGFRFSLPASWRGYTIVTGQWQGAAIGQSTDQKPTETGPMISIRHPQWTAQTPRQDIPIMVLTIDQWNRLQAGGFHIGAAPIGPRELGRNARYVFALPARYNFAFPTGYEEVETILQGNPLVPEIPSK